MGTDRVEATRQGLVPAKRKGWDKVRKTKKLLSEVTLIRAKVDQARGLVNARCFADGLEASLRSTLMVRDLCRRTKAAKLGVHGHELTVVLVKLQDDSEEAWRYVLRTARAELG